jgi:hypothetical protein
MIAVESILQYGTWAAIEDYRDGLTPGEEVAILNAGHISLFRPISSTIYSHMRSL